MPFKKAVKYDARLRLALAGPSGSGKTFTALTLACALAGEKGVALIDTERGSASKYARTSDDQGFDFDVLELVNYHPQNYIMAIHEAEAAGYAVLVIDSLTHAWNSVGGVLEIVDKATKRSQSKNAFTNGWSEATPLQNQLIDTITRSPLHVIVTMRSKTEYVLEKQGDKTVPRKIGMAPVQRPDIDYEFDVYAELTHEHTLLVQKSRLSELSGAVIDHPGSDLAEVLANWLSGEPAPEQIPTLHDSYRHGLTTGAWTKDTFYTLVSTLLNNIPVSRDTVLSPEQLKCVAEAAEHGKGVSLAS
jgi:energy-coupling factor transporter ATP-binding protein EcfA2